TTISLILAGLAGVGVLPATGQLWFVATLSSLGAAGAWRILGAGTAACSLPRYATASAGQTVAMKRPLRQLKRGLQASRLSKARWESLRTRPSTRGRRLPTGASSQPTSPARPLRRIGGAGCPLFPC